MSQEIERKRQKRRWIFGAVALGVFSLSAVLAIVGLRGSIEGIRQAEVAQSPTALLANAGAKTDRVVELPVTYYDQLSDVCDDKTTGENSDRQWEWETCGYKNGEIEQGLVETELGDDGLPVAKGKAGAKSADDGAVGRVSRTEEQVATGVGQLLPNKSVNLQGWFSESEGISKRMPGTLSMHFTKDDANFSFAVSDFYPLDDVDFSENDPANKYGHNTLFTMNFAVPFTVLASGEEKFTIRADDDTWVFLDGKLVIDLGGVHEAKMGAMTVDADGKVYKNEDNRGWKDTGVTLRSGETATLAVFHADRDSASSVFEVDFSGMSLALENGVQIASVTGDSAEGYVEPLGESKVFEADTAQSLLLIATIEGVVVIVAAVLVVSVARFMVRQKVEK